MTEKTKGFDELIDRAGKYLGETVSSNMMLIDRLTEICAQEDQRALVGKLFENNLRLLRFLRLYTTFALYKYGTEDFYPKNSDIRQLLLYTCRQIREVLGDTLILEEDILETPVVTVADSKNLKRCVLALLSNAAKNGKQRIRLSLKKTGAGLVIAVFDDGKPADKATRERIQKGLEGGVDNIDGSGMGLAVAAMIVKAHGGELKFVPRKNGNEFKITLPERVDDTLLFSAGVPEYGERFDPAVVELCDFYLKNLRNGSD